MIDFFIQKEHIKDLTSGAAIVMHSFLPNCLKPYEELSEVFKKDGPYGLSHSDYPQEFYEIMAQFSEALHKKHLISDFVPALRPDMKAGLLHKLHFGAAKRGEISCLDVGCGKGFHAAFLADHFPKSDFTGIDISPEAIHLASQLRSSNGIMYDNLTFIQMDGSKLNDNWTRKFDLFNIFDACHDQIRPDLVDGTSHIYMDKHKLGEIATMNYCASLFNCLPLGSNSEGALCLGSMWGRERAVKMLKEAGFNDVTVALTPYFETNVLYVSKKD